MIFKSQKMYLNLFKWATIFFPIIKSFQSKQITMESAHHFSEVRVIDETNVLIEKPHDNLTIYYFPAFFRFQLKYETSIDTETRFSTNNLTMFLSVFYGSVDKQVVEGLKEKIYIQPEFNEKIMLNTDDSADSKNNNDKKYQVYLQQGQGRNKNMLHWKIVGKEFRLKVKPHIFLHPFETIQLKSQIKVPTIQFQIGQYKVIRVVFNLMDNKTMHKKLIQDDKILNVYGFYLSPSVMELNIEKTHKQYKQIKIKIKEEAQLALKSTDVNKSLAFIQQSPRQIRHTRDYFSNAHINLHLHTGGKAAFANFFSNLLCFAMLSVLSVFVHFQKMEASQILASLATIAVAFGTSIISIRSQIIFKPGQTLFEIVYCFQMLVLVFPLFNYWQANKPPSTIVPPSSSSALDELSQSAFNSTAAIQVSETTWNQTVIYYLQQLLEQTRGKPLNENVWEDQTYLASVIITWILCIIIAVIFMIKVVMFYKFQRKKPFNKTVADSEFLRFDRAEWDNKQCRQTFNDLSLNPEFDRIKNLQKIGGI